VPPAPADPPSDRVQRERLRIGRRIATARLHTNLTQEGLAERAGLSRDTVYRVETGVRSARLDWLILIADALEVRLEDLVRA
jgi:transcriptional regulator with XRE-family HTH domain